MSAGWGFFWLDGSWGAGAALTQSLADTPTVTDATAKAASHLNTDTPTITDAARKAPVSVRTDSVTATDVAARAIGARPADSFSFVDIETETGELPEAIGKAATDSASVTDASRTASTNLREDTFTVTDSVATDMTGPETAAPADTAPVAETFGVTVGISFADGFLISDGTAPITSRLGLGVFTLGDLSEDPHSGTPFELVGAATGSLVFAGAAAATLNLGSGSYPGNAYPGQLYPGPQTYPGDLTRTGAAQTLTLTPA